MSRLEIKSRKMFRALAGAACLFSLAAFGAFGAFGADEAALTALLRQQTDLGSDAGQRGDQATMESFLDDEVLFSGGDGSVSRDTQFDKSDAVSALIKQQTQAFLDAGQRGDVAAMRRYLDHQVLFINEDGSASRWRNFAGGAPAAPPKGVPSSISISDWVLHYRGDVAVSSFIGHQLVRYDGQSLEYQYLTVETWVQQGAAWKLLGSETIPLHQDPPAMTLPPEKLQEYVGIYSAGPGSSVTVSLDQGALVFTTNGVRGTPLKPEARDVFFRAGSPPGYAPPRAIFRRDTHGLVSGYSSGGLIYRKSEPGTPQGTASAPATGPLVLRDFVVTHSGDVAVAAFFHDRDTPSYGQVQHQTFRSMETWVKRGTAWKMMASQGRALQTDPPALVLLADQLGEYSGRYVLGKNLTVTIAPTKDALAMSTNGGNPKSIEAMAPDWFFTPGSPRTSMIFERDPNGLITGFVSRLEGRDLKFTKETGPRRPL
jgi:Domain of unknown function (DUF4440)